MFALSLFENLLNFRVIRLVSFFQKDGHTDYIPEHHFLDCPRSDEAMTLPFSFVLKSGGWETPESLDTVTQLNVS